MGVVSRCHDVALVVHEFLTTEIFSLVRLRGAPEAGSWKSAGRLGGSGKELSAFSIGSGLSSDPGETFELISSIVHLFEEVVTTIDLVGSKSEGGRLLSDALEIFIQASDSFLQGGQLSPDRGRLFL